MRFSLSHRRILKFWGNTIRPTLWSRTSCSLFRVAPHEQREMPSCPRGLVLTFEFNRDRIDIRSKFHSPEQRCWYWDRIAHVEAEGVKQASDIQGNACSLSCDQCRIGYRTLDKFWSRSRVVRCLSQLLQKGKKHVMNFINCYYESPLRSCPTSRFFLVVRKQDTR